MAYAEELSIIKLRKSSGSNVFNYFTTEGEAKRQRERALFGFIVQSKYHIGKEGTK